MSGNTNDEGVSVSDPATQDAPETGRDGSRAETPGTEGDVTPPREDTPVSAPGVQDGPALSMHTTDDDERLDGLLAQMKADLTGQNAATIEHALRRRLDETGLTIDDAEVDRIVAELS